MSYFKVKKKTDAAKIPEGGVLKTRKFRCLSVRLRYESQKIG